MTLDCPARELARFGNKIERMHQNYHIYPKTITHPSLKYTIIMYFKTYNRPKLSPLWKSSWRHRPKLMIVIIRMFLIFAPKFFFSVQKIDIIIIIIIRRCKMFAVREERSSILTFETSSSIWGLNVSDDNPDDDNGDDDLFIEMKIGWKLMIMTGWWLVRFSVGDCFCWAKGSYLYGAKILSS